jgi:phosphatidylglycerol:prolipoprotein diacylglycerol transferase
LALPAPAPRNFLQAAWRRWAPQAAPERPILTRFEPFLRVPGTIPYIWMTFVLFGLAVALVTQSRLTAYAGRPVGPTLLATLGALAVGAVGAKVWYVFKEHDYIGWCIQGMILGAGLAAGLLYLLLHVPVGAALDAAAPGLMLGMAVGRIGCFFAGCCGGPPTAAPWGVWSSDQHMGARRIPTQLFEAGTSLVIGVLTLAALLTHGATNGAYFAVDVAAYILAREVILRMRIEKIKTRLPIPATAVAATLALIVALVVIGR